MRVTTSFHVIDPARDPAETHAPPPPAPVHPSQPPQPSADAVRYAAEAAGLGLGGGAGAGELLASGLFWVAVSTGEAIDKVWLCVCVAVRVRGCACVWLKRWSLTFACMRVHACMHACAYSYMHTMHACAYSCMHTCMCAYMRE